MSKLNWEHNIAITVHLKSNINILFLTIKLEIRLCDATPQYMFIINPFLNPVFLIMSQIKLFIRWHHQPGKFPKLGVPTV